MERLSLPSGGTSPPGHIMTISYFIFVGPLINLLFFLPFSGICLPKHRAFSSIIELLLQYSSCDKILFILFFK